jgi:hypothetical protein
VYSYTTVKQRLKSRVASRRLAPRWLERVWPAAAKAVCYRSTDLSLYLIGAGLVTVATSSMNVRTVVMPQLHGIPKILQVDANWSCVFMQIDRLEAFAVR